MIFATTRADAGKSYDGRLYDPVLEIYFAEARFYDAKNRQWMASDPIKDGLNWYEYARGNPATYFDPTGLDSYIIYDGNDNNEEKVVVMAEELEAYFGTPVHLIPVSSGNQLIDAWNGENNTGIGFDDAGNEVDSIEATILLAHGWRGGFSFKTKDGGWEIDRINLSDIEKFSNKAMQYFVMFSCNVGQTGDGTNVATEFYNKQKDNINKIIAADGDVYVNPTREEITTGWWIFKKTTITYGFDIYATGDSEKNKGFKVYSDNEKETVDYLGGLDHHFSSVTEMLDMARGLE